MNPIAAITEAPRTTARPHNTDPNIVEIVQTPIGQYLKKHRQHRTMREVGDAIGCDISYLSKIEHGHVVPPWDTVEKIARYYNISEALIPALAWKQLYESRQSQFSMAIAFWNAAT